MNLITNIILIVIGVISFFQLRIAIIRLRVKKDYEEFTSYYIQAFSALPIGIILGIYAIIYLLFIKN